MNGRCADCRHWQLPIIEAEHIAAMPWDEDAGRYQPVRVLYTYEVAPSADGLRRCYALGAADSGLLVDSHEGFTVETLPSFGCVQWQPQEAQ